jgi:hypothetical protein
VPLPLDKSDKYQNSRYRLTVVAQSVADVVGSAGGWLCDRARAGWDVAVVVADPHDARPLSILGATALDAEGDVSSAVRTVAMGGTLAISAALLEADERIRERVHNIVKRGVADVLVWGQAYPVETGKDDRVVHTLSSAARAFKAMALGAATDSAESVSSTETLVRLGVESLRPLYAV